MQKTSFTPSKLQQAIFDFITRAGNVASLIIEAVAGSGKTTTIVEVLKLLPSGLSVCFIAFNKSIVETLVQRIPPHILAKTFNSLGHGAVARHIGRRIFLNKNKVRKIIWDMFPKDASEEKRREGAYYRRFVERLVDLAKNEGIGCLVPDESSEWQRLIARHGLYLDNAKANESRAIEIAQDVLRTSTEQARTGYIDYNDQLFLTILWDLRLPQFDLILIDESQDTNRIQQAMVKKMLKAGGRVVAVGDTHQGIYGFRGADAEAMKRLKADFACEELPLSCSYRISKAVCKLAQQYVPHITTPDNARDGKVEHLDSYSEKTFTPNDVIICRNTAPLVSLAYSFISKAIGCKILGREIGENLISLVNKLDATSIDDLDAKLAEYRTREVSQLIDKGRDDAAAAVIDKCECIALLVGTLKETSRTIEALITAIEKLFSNDTEGLLTLCTAHRAKGLEWERVFILDFEKLMPSKYATQEWQLEQENNLIYVAITRAKLELYFIDSNSWSES